MSETQPEKKRRPRKVFGRVRTTTGGGVVTVTMTKTELIIRQLHRRRTFKIPVARAAMILMLHSELKDTQTTFPKTGTIKDAEAAERRRFAKVIAENSGLDPALPNPK